MVTREGCSGCVSGGARPAAHSSLSRQTLNGLASFREGSHRTCRSPTFEGMAGANAPAEWGLTDGSCPVVSLHSTTTTRLPFSFPDSRKAI